MQTRPAKHDLAGALAALDTHCRDRLSEAVQITARDLLNASDINVALPKVAEWIGTATGVDRVHVFLIDAASGLGNIVQHWGERIFGHARANSIPERAPSLKRQP